MKQKTKDISIFEYFRLLQLEYFSFELRMKIYPDTQRKEYFKKILVGKEKTINDIANRNNLFSIFNDAETRNEFYTQIYSTPCFMYRDETFEEKYSRWDWHNYYSIGSEVNFVSIQGNMQGIISRYNWDKKTVVVKNSSLELFEIEQDKVKRIL